MPYIVKTSFYEGNTLHEAGTVFEHSDSEYVAKCLEDGNIAEAGDDTSTPLPSSPSAPDGDDNSQPSSTDQSPQTSQVEPNGFPLPEDSTPEASSPDNPGDSSTFGIS